MDSGQQSNIANTDKPTREFTSRQVGWYVFISLASVFVIHLLGRIGYYEGLYSFPIADAFTLFALIVLGATTCLLFAFVYETRIITYMAAVGALLILVGQVINIVDGIPAFGGMALPMRRSLLFLKEPVSGIGIVLFVGGLFWGAYETHKARRQALQERERLAVEVEARRKAFEELEQVRAQLEERVAERTAELTQALDTLRETAGRTAAIMDIAPVVIWVSEDPQCLNIKGNKAANRFYEAVEGENVSAGATDARRFFKDGRELSADELPMQQAAATGQEVLGAEVNVLLSSGRRITVFGNAAPLRASDGAVSGSVGVFMDITAWKQAQESLARSESKYRELVENANSIILRMDREGRVTFFNEFAEWFFGYTEEEILGKDVVGTIVPHDDTQGRDLSAMIHDIGEHTAAYVNNENENMRRNGERVWIAWTNRPILDEDGNVQEILCIGNDVTSRVRTERLLAEQRIKMIESARLASLGLMAGSVAHEINNPLSVISGCIEQLEPRVEAILPDDPLTDKLLPMIQRNIGRIKKVIHGLRALSRDGSGDPFVEASIGAVIADTIEICEERFRLHGIRINTATSPPNATVECRPSQIAQVILNLLNNSFDAVKDLPEQWISIEAATLEDCMEICVTDSGPGIPSDVHRRLFFPFFTTKSEQHGLGLGLSISQGIIEAHHGEIAIDPTSSNTCFRIRLPLCQPRPERT